MKVKELIKLLQSDDIDPEDKIYMSIEDEGTTYSITGIEDDYEGVVFIV